MTGEPPRSQHKLASFDLSDMIRCGRGLRSSSPGLCMEDAAQSVVDYLRAVLVSETGELACPLVRCFKTHPLGKLPDDLAEIARASLRTPTSAHAEVPCLTLLGSSGELPDWNGRHGSRGHRAIPLESVEVVERAPMIARLMRQLGVSLHDVLAPTQGFLLDAEQRAFGVFHVAQALGSEFVPAQAFVQHHSISSVLGFGGLLPSGDLFAVIVFTRVPLSREVAEQFRTIALSTKLVLLPFHGGPIFREDLQDPNFVIDPQTQEGQRAEIATLQLLVPALEDVALAQTAKLRLAAHEAEQRAEDVRQLNAVLERRVEERTAALQAINEELQSFSYSVSHDLRAPLRTIDGFSAAIEEDYVAVLDDTARSHLKRIRTAAQRMGDLIDSMLQLARVSSAELAISPVDLSKLAAGIAAELAEGAPSRAVEWTIEPALSARGDPRLLRALLQNLLANAFKFTGRTPQARISLGWSPEKNAFFVRDNGAGFAMQDFGKLFQAFSRLHTAEQFEGTGVGLATVARIVRRHGGSLWADAAPGEGATFWFRLDRGPTVAGQQS